MATPNLAAVQTMIPKVLYSGQLSATTDTAVFTVPASTSAIVKHGVLCNTNQPVATGLSALLSTGSPITALPVTALPAALPSGAQVILGYQGNVQTWTLSAPAAALATSLTVGSQTPGFAYPAGSSVTSIPVSVLATVAIVPSGGSADGTHVVISQYLLNPGDSLPLTEYLGGANLGDGDAIHVQASVANVLNATITGVQST